MPEPSQTDHLKGRVRGLPTLALLKARFDEGVDHIDMFMPFVIDTVAATNLDYFSAEQIRDELFNRHSLAMPVPSIKTLLSRVTKRGQLRREHGVYRKTSDFRPGDDITRLKNHAQQLHAHLAGALRLFAQSREVPLESDDRALELLLHFLEENEVALLLDTPLPEIDPLSAKEAHLVAAFCQHVIATAPELASTLKGIIEGLVLCNTAFLRDIGTQRRQFQDLSIYLDSNILRQALGYDGPVQERLMREAIRFLISANALCKVFDKTVDELKGILALYEKRLATPQGKRSLRPTDMTRYFYKMSPSDVVQKMATLEMDIRALGLKIVATPQRLAPYTLDEAALQGWLADNVTGDDTSPRVRHDVDCAAAILTLRRGRTFTHLDDVKHVFATLTGKVVENVTRWFQEQGQDGISPVVHLRALVNLAWFRCPQLAGNLKIQELVALCSAALRPAPETWNRFRKHLEKLQAYASVTTDEMIAVLASHLTDRLLVQVEDEQGDEPDAASFDEIVERVRESYKSEARKDVEAAEANMKRAAEDANAARLQMSRVQLSTTVRVRAISRVVAGTLFHLLAGSVAIGASVLLYMDVVHIRLAWVAAVGIFLLMEFLGVLRHASQLRGRWEAWIFERLYAKASSWLGLPAD